MPLHVGYGAAWWRYGHLETLGFRAECYRGTTFSSCMMMYLVAGRSPGHVLAIDSGTPSHALTCLLANTLSPSRLLSAIARAAVRVRGVVGMCLPLRLLRATPLVSSSTLSPPPTLMAAAEKYHAFRWTIEIPPPLFSSVRSQARGGDLARTHHDKARRKTSADEAFSEKNVGVDVAVTLEHAPGGRTTGGAGSRAGAGEAGGAATGGAQPKLGDARVPLSYGLCGMDVALRRIAQGAASSPQGGTVLSAAGRMLRCQGPGPRLAASRACQGACVVAACNVFVV